MMGSGLLYSSGWRGAPTGDVACPSSGTGATISLLLRGGMSAYLNLCPIANRPPVPRASLPRPRPVRIIVCSALARVLKEQLISEGGLRPRRTLPHSPGPARRQPLCFILDIDKDGNYHGDDKMKQVVKIMRWR
jgi:hypothetical protein